MIIVIKEDLNNAYRFFLYENEKNEKSIFVRMKYTGEVLCYDFIGKEWSKMSLKSFKEFQCGLNEKEKLYSISKSNALWWLEGKRAFNGQGNDKAVKEIMDLWKEKKELYREEWFKYGGNWPAKYVKTAFYLNGKYYEITPYDIGLSHDGFDQGFMESLQYEIGADLAKIGATDIMHFGFLD